MENELIKRQLTSKDLKDFIKTLPDDYTIFIKCSSCFNVDVVNNILIDEEHGTVSFHSLTISESKYND